MSEQIAQGVIKIGVDSTGVKAGTAAVQSDLRALGDAAGAAGKKIGDGIGKGSDDAAKGLEGLDQTQKRYIASLKKKTDMIGKLPSEYAAYRASMLGVSKEADQYVSKLRAQEQATSHLGISMKQTAAAMRMVPAQMTDIFTSLAGGQNPLLVAIQQGGQLKDSFGGLGNMSRALIGMINPVIAGVTAFGAAAVYAGKLIYDASNEVGAFQNAIKITGDSAAVSVNQFRMMQEEVAKATGAQGEAAQVLTQIAATGKIASDGFAGIAQAAIQMERASISPIDKTIEMFVKLSEEPVKASLKLNETYHYLNASTVARIRALEDEGRATEAGALAVRLFYQEMNQRTAQGALDLGYLRERWNYLIAAIREAKNLIGSIGRPDMNPGATITRDAEERLAGLRKMQQDGERLSRESPGSPLAKPEVLRQRQAEIEKVEQLIEKLKGVQQADDDRAKKSQENVAATQKEIEQKEALKRWTDAVAGSENKRAEAHKKARAELSAADYEAIAPMIDKKFPDPAVQQSASAKVLENVTAQTRVIETQLALGEKLKTMSAERVKFESDVVFYQKQQAEGVALTDAQKNMIDNQDEIRKGYERLTEAEKKFRNAQAPAAFTRRFGTEKQKEQQAIQDQETEFGRPLTKEERGRVLATIKPPSAGPKAKPYKDDASTRMLEQLNETSFLLKAQLNDELKLTDASEERAKWEGEIAFWKAKQAAGGQLTDDQKNILANEAIIRAKRIENEQNAKTLSYKKDTKGLDDLIGKQLGEDALMQEKVTLRIQEQNAAAEALLDTQRQIYKAELDSIGLGDSARKRTEGIGNIQTGFSKERNELERDKRNMNLAPGVYDEQVKILNDRQTREMQMWDDHYKALKEKQTEASLGASEAIANYLDDANNRFEQTKGLMERSFGALEDAWVQFATTGKLSFSDFAKSVVADLARMQAKAAIASILGLIKGAAAPAANVADVGAGANGLVELGTGTYYPQARAAGGPVSGMTPYLVGEKGPEIFMPRNSGAIVPNNQLKGGSTTSVVQHIQVGGGDGGQSSPDRDAMRRMFKDGVRQGLMEARQRNSPAFK